jgi:hypothetical protein
MRLTSAVAIRAASSPGPRTGRPVRRCRRLRPRSRNPLAALAAPRHTCGPRPVPRAPGPGVRDGPAGCHGPPHWTTTPGDSHRMRPGGPLAHQARSSPQYLPGRPEPLSSASAPGRPARPGIALLWRALARQQRRGTGLAHEQVRDRSGRRRLAHDQAVIRDEHQILAPALLRSQVLSLLYQAVHRGEMTKAEADRQLSYLPGLRIRLLGDRVLPERRLEGRRPARLARHV